MLATFTFSNIVPKYGEERWIFSQNNQCWNGKNFGVEDKYTGIPCKGQPEAHYSKFSFKQYFPFQHEHLTLDLTKIHEIFFFPNDEGVATNFHNGGDSSVEL